ncbi:hypothetical protein ACFQS1_39920 [Paractinoplanes rhizophilus]|uniref:Uncharacterized protein n=1 Tax=Paractinoplanes rhizophilus TaxID=1416877 RepID=A0ABW2I5P8_9ACTN
MAYVVQAVIAAPAALEQCRALDYAVVVELDQGLRLMPMTTALFDEVRQGDTVDERFASCVRFPPGFEATLATWSALGPVAYVEAEYFAGTGSQFSAVWHHGEIVLGPLLKAEDDPLPAQGSPISQALRYLGVSTLGHYDEFEAVGMIRHRHVRGWRADMSD